LFVDRYFWLGITAVIVLLNVLIAVVVDAYSNIRNKSSEEVFWSSRLEFATEVVLTCNLISQLQSVKFENAWTSISNFYKDTRTENEKATANKFGSKFIDYIFLRFIFCPIVALWFTAGLITFGLLWPPQVRDWISESLDRIFSSLWVSIIRVFEDKRILNRKGVPHGSKAVYYLVPRALCALLIIIWLTAGALIFGIIWPPQVREMYWNYGCPKKSLNDEELWKESIKDIKRIVKAQEASKMSEINFKHLVTELRAEMAQVVERQDKNAEVITHYSNQMVETMKKIALLLENEKQEVGSL
jgi:hypothetical protein